MRAPPASFIVVFCALLWAHAPASGQLADSTENHFFHEPELGYGSEETVSPLSMLLNRGFSNLLYADMERRPHKIEWRSGLSTVFEAVLDPLPAIDRRGGWGAFLDSEFLPGVGPIWTWGWSVNYAGHILGGGVTYRYMREWFQDQGVSRPGLWAGTALMTMMVVNEVVEARGSTVPSAGTTADLLVFDPLGILVFSHDGIARFVGMKLRAADWSPQAALTFPDGRILNNSQTLAYKVPLPKTDRLRLLFVVGLAAQSGLTYEFADGYGIGAAAGFHASERIVDPVTQNESIRAAWSGGLYLDRHDSLLASFVMESKAYNRIRANLYPGILPGRLRRLGLWATLNQGNEVSLGISMYRGAGMALGYDLHRGG